MIKSMLVKDIRIKTKSPIGFLLLMALPLVFTFLMGSIFGSSGEQATLPTIKVLIEDNDNSLYSNLMLGAFRNGEMAEMFNTIAVGKDSGRALMDAGEASALLIIPEGFQDSLMAQGPTELIVIKNPSESFLPKIIEETVNILAEGTDRLFQIYHLQFGSLEFEKDADDWLKPAQVARIYVQFKTLATQVDGYLFPSLIELNKETLKNPDEETQQTGNLVLAYILSGIAAMSIFFVLESLGRDYYREYDNKTLYRIMSSPAGLFKFIIAKQSFLIAMGLIAFFMMWTIGVLVFGIRIAWKDFIPFTLVAVLLVVALAGIIGFLFALAKTRNVSSSLNPAIIIFFSIFGGAMVPLQSLPEFMKRMAVISPVYWGVDGLQKILIDHQSLLNMGAHILVLAVLALVFNGLALIIFSRRYGA